MLTNQAFDEAVKLARRVRVLIDAGEHKLAMQLISEGEGGIEGEPVRPTAERQPLAFPGVGGGAD